MYSHDSQMVHDLVLALDGVVKAWWDEFSGFFGRDADNVSYFESQPAVIAARTALELVRRSEAFHV